MKLRVQVLTAEKKNHNGKPYQTMGVHYPSKLLPVEVEVWLGKLEPFPKGEYFVDLTEALMPDPQNYNNPRLDLRQIRPNLAAAPSKNADPLGLQKAAG